MRGTAAAFIFLSFGTVSQALAEVPASSFGRSAFSGTSSFDRERGNPPAAGAVFTDTSQAYKEKKERQAMARRQQAGGTVQPGPAPSATKPAISAFDKPNYNTKPSTFTDTSQAYKEEKERQAMWQRQQAAGAAQPGQSSSAKPVTFTDTSQAVKEEKERQAHAQRAANAAAARQTKPAELTKEQQEYYKNKLAKDMAALAQLQRTPSVATPAAYSPAVESSDR